VPTTIADFWFLTQPHDYIPDIRAPLFSSRQIEGEIRRANTERRGDHTDWTAIHLEELIRMYLCGLNEPASAGVREGVA
jgi:hypothetical protein